MERVVWDDEEFTKVRCAVKLNFSRLYPNFCHSGDVSPKQFRTIVDQYEEKISTCPEEFKKLYIFTFNYAKSTGQKSMDIEVY